MTFQPPGPQESCGVTIKEFRRDFPAFADDDRYPSFQVEYWFMVADLLLTNRWPNRRSHRCPERSLKDVGAELFVAHNLALEVQAQDRAELGGVPGAQVGVISSVGVNGANVSYDTQAGIVTDANHWNLTTYGVRFINLAKMVGSAPLQLGIGAQRGQIPPPGARSPNHAPTVGEGWPGPPTWVLPWFP